MEDFRGRTANDRAAALEAKYDPEDDIAMRRLGAPIEASAFLTNFAKTHNKLKIVAGFMDGKVLDQKQVAVIATLPSLEEARAKIVGILSSPAQKLVSILLAPGSKIANLARAKSLKK